MATAQQNADFLDYFRRLFGGDSVGPVAAPAPAPWWASPPPAPTPAPTPVAAAEPAPWWGENKPDPVDFFSQLYTPPPPPPPPTPEQIEEGKRGLAEHYEKQNQWLYENDPEHRAGIDWGRQLATLSDLWQKQGINPNQAVSENVSYLGNLQNLLGDQGIRDITKLSVKDAPYEDWITTDYGTEAVTNQGKALFFGDKRIDLSGASSNLSNPQNNVYTIATSPVSGGGQVAYNAYVGSDGAVRAIYPQFIPKPKDSFLSDILPILSVLAIPFTGGLSATLGGGAATLGSTMAANALIQGGLGGLASAAQGGDFLEGALKGGATGAFTAGIGSVVNPIASSIGSDVLNATDSKFLSDIVSGAVKGVPGALMSGDASNLLTGAVTGAVGSQVGNELGLTPQQSQVATNIASKLLQGGDLSLSDIAKIGTSFAPGPAMPGTTGNEITEGFFDEDGPGFMPTEYLDDAEVDRELQSLLGRYPAPQPPSDWFPGENIASGIPEWDMAAVNAGLPIGNLEQDFMVNERGQIVDSAGNVGNFVNGKFVVDTGVTPNLSYAATSAPAPGPSPSPSPAPRSAPRPSVAPTPRSSEAQLTRYDPVLAQVDPYDLDRLFSIGRQGGMTIEDLLKVISGETTRRRS